MPTINFPSSPVNGSTYSFNNILYTYDGYVWQSQGTVGPQGPAGATGPGLVYKSTTNSTAISGTTSNLVADSRLIPANTYIVGDIVDFAVRAIKTGTSAGYNLRVYINGTSSISGGTITAFYGSTTATNIFLELNRSLFIKSSTSTEVLSPTGFVLDSSAITSVVSGLNIDWTTDQYLVFALQLGTQSGSGDVSTDSAVISGYKIIKY